MSWNGTSPEGENYPRTARIARRGEFQVVYSTGTRRTSPNFVVFVRANGLGHSRFGISMKKGLGGAVVRNRVRRQVREMLRLNRKEIPAGWDIVVHPRHPAIHGRFADLTAELLKLITAAATAPARRQNLRP
jgi:ribonuclease P protein component